MIELGPLTAPLTDISGQGVRQKLKFLRKKRDNSHQTVGFFVTQLKLVGEEDVPAERFDKKRSVGDVLGKSRLAQTNRLKKDFHWRVKVDIRHAVDLSLNRKTESGLPGALVELG